MRRLWAQDKSGAGETSSVSMEERETEEFGGSSKEKHSHRRRLPATVFRGKKLSLLSVQLLPLPPTSLSPGEGSPHRGATRGREREFLYVAVIQWGRGRRLSRRKKKGKARE